MSQPVATASLQDYIENYPTMEQGKEALLRLLGRLAICANFSPQREDKDHLHMMEELLCLYDKVSNMKAQ